MTITGTIIQVTLAVVSVGGIGWLILEAAREKRRSDDDLMREFGMACKEIANMPLPRVVVNRSIKTWPTDGWCLECSMPILPDPKTGTTCLCAELSLERYRRTKNHG